MSHDVPSGTGIWLRRMSLLLLTAASLLPLVPAVPAQIDLTPEPAPEPPIYRDWQPRCDAHGPPGLVAHEFLAAGGVIAWDYPAPGGLAVLHSLFRGYDASNGSRIWTVDGGAWHKLPGPQLLNDHYWAPIRGGAFYSIANSRPYYLAPTPGPVDNFQAIGDADGDGICDYLAYSWKILSAAQGQGQLQLLSGATGTSRWQYPINWNRIDAPPVYNISGFPTGLLAFQSANGPRFAFKTTDIIFEYNTNTWLTTEHIVVGDARDGHVKWTRTLLPSVTSAALSTYITGARDADGDGEPEVFLDDFSALEGQCNSQPGRLDAWALSGTTGATLWGPVPFFTPIQTGQLSGGEDDSECWLWSNAKVVGDLNGDGRTDVVGTYFGRLGNGGGLSTTKATTNGRFRTHVAPIESAKGGLLWPNKDIKTLGWGHVDDLNPDSTHSVPYLAVGTLDLPSPPVPGGRFPPKDVRMTVYKIADGAPVWGSYRDRYAQDSFLIYGLTLDQFKNALAPRDYDGDGVRDLVTPAIYTEPNATTQLLLASSGHDYKILSGATGKVISVIDAFGPRGEAVVCPGEADNQLTIVSGHSRRVDLTRRNVTDDAVAWRTPVYVNRRPQAQVAGSDTLYLAAHCAVDDAGATVYGASDGILSARRGLEVRPLRGLLEGNGTPTWILPKFNGIPPNVATLTHFALPPEPPLTSNEKMGYSAGSVVSGAATAIGLVALHTRMRRGGGAS